MNNKSIKSPIRITACAVTLFFICLHSAVASAANIRHPLLTEPFSISVGMFAPKRDVTLQVDGQVINKPIHLEQIFEGDKNRRFGLGNIRWRFGDRWSVSGQFWRIGRKSSKVLDRDIGFRDTFIEAGSFVKANISTSVNRLFLVVFYGTTISLNLD